MAVDTEYASKIANNQAHLISLQRQISLAIGIAATAQTADELKSDLEKIQRAQTERNDHEKALVEFIKEKNPNIPKA